MYSLGVDVGGTNTDAVIINDKNEVILSIKSPTTEDVTTGIKNSIKQIIEKADGINASDISYAMLGTTHCTNAIVQRKDLNKVAVIRIGAPATLAIKPLSGIPDDFSSFFENFIYIVGGGHEFNGSEIAPLDEKYLYEIANEIKGKVSSIAISSVFSPVNTAHEDRAEEIMKEVLGENINVSLSYEIGSVGLLERENATVLNAAVLDVTSKTANGFKEALKNQGINPKKIFFSQNDGTLMSIEYTMKYPILTIACGPTNSLRGASFLGNISDAITVDVGGTTSDVGILVKGFPRESSLSVEIGGVRTNFRMPDVLSIGLGGGTKIYIDEEENIKIGPSSVGYKITTDALVFGGETLTTTDVAVALGYANIGDKSKVKHLDKTLLNKIYSKMKKMLEDEIDKMKTSSEPVPVILVGGGADLFPDELKGASKVIKHKTGGAANAIGAAIAQVSGQIEKVFALDELGREATLEKAKNLAIDEAIKAGADLNTIEIVSLDDVPLAYLPGNATKITVKAAGNLA